MRVNVAGTQSEHRLEFGDRSFQIALCLQSHPEIIVSFRIVRLEVKGLAEFGDCLLILTDIQQSICEIEVGREIVGLQSQGVLKLVDGLTDIAFEDEGHTEIVMLDGFRDTIGHTLGLIEGCDNLRIGFRWRARVSLLGRHAGTGYGVGADVTCQNKEKGKEHSENEKSCRRGRSKKD